MARILLQKSVPYGQSLKWDIHHRYFQQRGSAAWLKSEIPYYVTSNTAAALQKVKMIVAAVERMEQEGSMRQDEPIVVMEFASGLGLFASNFIRMFKWLDEERGTFFAKRLRYLFTDYSAKTVHDAAQVPKLREFAQEGMLTFGVVDALSPQDGLDLEGRPLPLSQITAVISNYLQCCLPLTILRKNKDGWHEKHILLRLDVPEQENEESFVKRALEEPVGFDVMKRLTEDEEYFPLAKDVIRRDLHLEVMDSMAKTMEVVTLPYPYGSLQHIEKTLLMLRSGGIMLHSDKGYGDVSYWEGNRACEPSLHGNCFAHSFNFPLIRGVVQAMGLSAAQTEDISLGIKTIMIENRSTPALGELFQTLYVKNNANIDRADFMKAGNAFKNEEENQEAALRFIKRALLCAPEDCEISFNLAKLLFTMKQYTESAKIFEHYKAIDIFDEYDSDFEIGRAYWNLKQYTQAIEKYEQSITRQDHEVTRYNVGLCYEEIGQIERAKENYARALMINPHYEKPLDCLKKLSKS